MHAERAARPELHEILADRLEATGHRYTAARRQLVDALLTAARPVTLPELLGVDRSLRQSSAYRNLSVLESAGVVRRLVHSPGHAHYELAENLTGHQHHLICEECGSIRDVTLDARIERSLDQAFAGLAAGANFAPRHHELDLYGRCEDCATA